MVGIHINEAFGFFDMIAADEAIGLIGDVMSSPVISAFYKNVIAIAVFNTCQGSCAGTQDLGWCKAWKFLNQLLEDIRPKVLLHEQVFVGAAR